jgi:hypothetical protein
MVAMLDEAGPPAPRNPSRPDSSAELGHSRKRAESPRNLKKKSLVFKKMARPEGFEPPTPTFVALYSIQLSYGRALAPEFWGPRSYHKRFQPQARTTP